MDNTPKSGFMTLIGRPNMGKSTLMNCLIGQKATTISDKPQTTRGRVQTMYTDERGQIIFPDILGTHKTKNKLDEYMVNVAEHIMSEVDVILWLVELTAFIGARERHIAEQLQKVKMLVMLVINEIDTVKDQDETLKFIDVYKDIRNFVEVAPVSALKGKNTELVTGLIFKYLPERSQFYDEDTVTNQPMRQITAELIRGKALWLLNDKIPHGIAVTTEKMTERKNGMIDIETNIVCERDSHKGIIVGKGGAVLKRIGTATRVEIENLMGTKVNLQPQVRVCKERRDDGLHMENYGYNPKEQI